jgi:hypothetical protein
MSRRPSLAPRGFTAVELVVYVMILALLFLMISKLFPFMSQTQKGVQRLDILHVLRNTSEQIANAVSYSTKIVYPKLGDGEFRSVLGFLNRKNGLMVVFFDTKRQELRLWDCDERKGITLGSGNMDFSVRRKDRNFLSYKLSMSQTESKTRERDFSLSNSVSIRNDFR